MYFRKAANFFEKCAHNILATKPFTLPVFNETNTPPPFFLEILERKLYQHVPTKAHDAGQPLLLTPLIEAHKFKEAKEAAKVDSAFLLPNMESYAGYLTVNKEYNANLWFWYFPVSGKPVETTPWIIWLQGGPGSSSLYGLFTEIGPIHITKDNKLEEMEYSWGRDHSLLFIDNPVGTGFSFTDDDRGYATNQTTIGENLYNALQQFLTLFPELRKAPLTLAGESYAGKHIPSLGVQIHWHQDKNKPINLQSLAIGNGFIDPLTLRGYTNFVREVGLVDDSVADAIGSIETSVASYITDGELVMAYNFYNYMLRYFIKESHQKNVYNYLKDHDVDERPYLDYIERDDVRRALHVGNTSFVSLDLTVFNKLIPDFMNSSKVWLEELLDHYKVMLYSGQLDIMVAYHNSVNTYNSLVFSGKEKYAKADRLPWMHNGRLSGYYKQGGNLVDVMVRGAGHMVPTDKPEVALALISAFIQSKSLLEDTGHLVETGKKL